MKGKKLVARVTALRGRAEDRVEMVRHAQEQLEQMVADGAEEISVRMRFKLTEMNYILEHAEGYEMGHIRALTEVLGLINDEPC